MRSTGEVWLPIDGPPIGLVTWYAPRGPVAAVFASWLAVIAGHPPELRAGCPGRLPGTDALPVGTEFAINIPTDETMPLLRKLMHGVASGGPVMIDAGPDLLPARLVHAPLLAGCALQLECARGRIVPGDWEPELAGDILLLHRGGLFLDPADHTDFCALRPLRTVFPS